MSRLLALLALSAACLAAMAVTAGAQSLDQSAQYGRGYLTPFPEGDRYRLFVFGDSLGDGIWAGLYRAFRPDDNVEVVKKSRVSTGFVRLDYFNWNDRIRDIARAEKFHIAVVMVGANDMQPIRHDRKFHKIDSEGWREIYGQRIDTFIKRLKESHAAVYWVGLPVMRSAEQNAAMQVMNEIFREKAFVNGVKFIDTWNGFADQFGRYSAFGPDLSGQVRRLRADDGVHFTMKGYRKLAHFVEREIRRDMRGARAERDIPLAGDEPEQARAVPHGRQDDREEAKNRDGKPASVPSRETSVTPEDKEAETSAAETSEKVVEVRRIQDGKITTSGEMAIVRPEISASATAGATAGYSPEGETIASDIAGGLTALASVSPINDPNLSGPQRLPLTQRPYYRVLIKGEKLKSKTGRADDFSWPGS